MGRLLEGFGVGIISYTVTWNYALFIKIDFLCKSNAESIDCVYHVQVPVYIAEIAPQNLRGGLGSVNQVGSGSVYHECFDEYLQKALITSQTTQICMLSVQLSITLGIMLTYLLGLFVEWRILAVLGNNLTA